MPNTASTALFALAAVWLAGWILACIVDATIARWPESQAVRQELLPAPVRWLILFYLWPLTLRAIFGTKRRTR